MRVLCAYIPELIKPETLASLQAFAPPENVVAISSDDDEAYWREICRCWTGEEDLVIIEHDMVLTAEMLPSFANCSELWCAYGYTAAPHLGRITAALGCTKFSAELQRVVSTDDIQSDKKEMPWNHLDVRIAQTIFYRKVTPHDHGDVEHLHTGYMPWLDLGKPREAEFTSDEYMHFVPPVLVGAGNRALFGLKAYADWERWNRES